MKVASVLSNKIILKSLDKISEHGTSFAAATSLLFSVGVRPLVIKSTPDVKEENKQYAMSNSICSGLVKFGVVEAIAIPIENAIKKIDKNPENYLKQETLKNLTPRAYKFLTQGIKQTIGLVTAIPKSVLTVAFIPLIMDKIFHNKTDSKTESGNAAINEPLSFTGNTLPKIVAKAVNNKSLQNIAIKYQNDDKNIAKHITAGTDILLTATSVHQTNKSKDIKENRKKALNYNNIISTAITIVGGYVVDNLLKHKTDNLINEFKQLNAKDPKLSKYLEGINILRPAIIFAGIYYCILPIFSTYIAEKIDNRVNKNISVG